MKLLYIVPKIKNEGGVARVLAIKANYFIEKFGYDVHILSQNEDNVLPFYDFNDRVVFHNMILEGNVVTFFNSFIKNINFKIEEINPDIIVVADNGLKAFIFPFIAQRKVPIVFECHGSLFIEEKSYSTNFLLKLKYWFKGFGANKYNTFVALSNESLEEWNVKNGFVIPNPSWIETEIISTLNNKKVIAIARNSYEKGLDRLFLIWKKISEKYPDWTLEIYTDEVYSLKELAYELGLKSNINYFDFVKNIQEKYVESSIYVMTSRTEGFPMVLLEAMASGLPSVAYDCPIGPRTMITNAKNGFLIPDNDINMFVEKLSFLIDNEEERLKFGKEAKSASAAFQVDKIMLLWKSFLENLISN